MAVGGKRKQRRHGNFGNSNVNEKGILSRPLPARMLQLRWQVRTKSICFCFVCFSMLRFQRIQLRQQFLCFMLFFLLGSLLLLFISPRNGFHSEPLRVAKFVSFCACPISFVFVFQKALNEAMKSFSMFIVTRCVSRNQWSGIKRITFLLLTCHSPPTRIRNYFRHRRRKESRKLKSSAAQQSLSL